MPPLTGPPEYSFLGRRWKNIRHNHRISIRPLVYVVTALIGLLTFYYAVIFRDSFFVSVPGIGVRPTTPAEWAERSEGVKRAFVHAWNGYEKYALPSDELFPLNNMSSNKFNGWGVTVYDSLDTMYLMGLDDEFKRALSVVEQADFALDDKAHAPFFETTIRYLGGLLSAFALSKEPILLDKADELARLLSPIFGTKSGFPLFAVNTVSGATRGPEIGILAEIASFQLEYTYLAQASGKKEHNDRAAKAINALAQANLLKVNGMFPKGWNLTSGQTHDTRLSVGAAADSAHEYLLKQYLLTGKVDKVNLEMYLRFTTYILTHLVYISPTRKLMYVTDRDVDYGTASHRLEHLSCFLPGLLSLGVHTLPLHDLASLGIDYNNLSNGLNARTKQDYRRLSKYNLTELHMWAARGIAETCYLSYADQPSGLGPEELRFNSSGKLWIEQLDEWTEGGRKGAPPGLEEGKQPVVLTEQQRFHGSPSVLPQRDYGVMRTDYLLRPETLESLYLLWRTTGEAKWREYGWTIFQAIETQCKTYSGYASLKNVEKQIGVKANDMPSYFMAETLKYLYLMFLENDPISLDEWVFNTEAHPLPVFHWTEAEKKKFGINY